MSIQKAHNGDIELAYEVHGPPEGIPLLLTGAGAGAQMAMWPPKLVATLVDRGFQVAMMDLRDSGLSTHLTQYDGVTRRRGELAYTLRDMTDDAIAVLDALGWQQAVMVGVSQSGIIAQAIACEHPDRVSALVSWMSQPTASLWLARPRIGRALRMIKVMRGTSPDRDAEGQKWVELFRLFATKQYPADDDHWREAGRVAFDRGIYPQGLVRQFAATRAAGDRRGALAQLRIPTLVLHGARDRLVSPKAGQATADAIPGARFMLLPNVDHQVPPPLWPMAADAIRELVAERGTSPANTSR